jgi:hypothetical protein
MAMKNPLGMFVLTRREQRVIIVIMMVLLAATIAKRYRHSVSEMAARPTPTATPFSSPVRNAIEPSFSPY